MACSSFGDPFIASYILICNGDLWTIIDAAIVGVLFGVEWIAYPWIFDFTILTGYQHRLINSISTSLQNKRHAETNKQTANNVVLLDRTSVYSSVREFETMIHKEKVKIRQWKFTSHYTQSCTDISFTDGHSKEQCTQKKRGFFFFCKNLNLFRDCTITKKFLLWIFLNKVVIFVYMRKE